MATIPRNRDGETTTGPIGALDDVSALLIGRESRVS
jgi:hypothetical protein